ncbi:FecR domain-containing protein [Yeosuana sp. MJ-SS3]|uniref:FecR domain-containing protein n=1 Tax=Gilvirhabdus luticola TaxID=3079858 RepID=A0ABU3U2W1_9FLAO|nr:FecR domain-containing protein [Yeosuana sp. MJ-SS3]MDU8884676.1 FecR domain-containing protein [Yeosuana sp. MJ-SS3]
MDKQFSKDSFLARWVSGDLSSQELEAFKKSEDFVVFNKINEASKKLEAPIFNAQGLFNKIQKQKSTKTSQEETKVIRLIPSWAYGVAASIVIALGVFYFTNMQSEFNTEYSEQLAVVLPDQSKVELNSNSHLYFKKLRWNSNREVSLDGEAFFDVEKGSTFRVITSEGTIEVLGTEFNVVSRDNYFEVLCHEGKVQVENIDSGQRTVLTKGKAARFVNNSLESWDFNQLKPDWLSGESTFKNAPLSQVIIDLENKYNINFDASNIDKDKRFTGGFTHKDLNLALKTVFTPMEISFTVNEKNIIVLNSAHKIQRDK